MPALSILFALFACGEPPVIQDDKPSTLPVLQPSPAPVENVVPVAEAKPVDLPTVDGGTMTMPLNGVKVHITAHTPAADTPCWTFVSDGLFGNQVAITVRRDRKTELSPILHFIQSLHDQGLEAAPRIGEASGMGPDGPGFVGAQTFYGVFFAPPIELSGVAGTKDALAGILLTGVEAEWAFKIGPQRTLARLGHANGTFPTTAWADPTRPSVIDPTLETSPENERLTSYLPSLQVSQIDDTTLELAISLGHLQALKKSGRLTKPGALRLFGGRSPTVDGLFVHLPNSKPTAITHVSSPKTLGLNGLLIDVGPSDSVGYVEDYAALVLTEDAWTPLWDAFAKGEPTEVTLGDTTVRIVKPGWDWPVVSVAAEPPPADILLGPRVEGVELTLSEQELRERIPVDDLKTAIGLLEVEVINYATSNPAPQTKLIIGVTFAPDGTMQLVPQWPAAQASTQWWDGMETALRTLSVPTVKDSVVFRLQLAFD